MFTGIIEELGKIVRIENLKGNRLLTIGAQKVIDLTKIGDSIAVNGVCLTVVKIENKNLSFEVIPETLDKTNLKFLKVSDSVNLERSLKFNERIGGHLLSGHIDTVGIIRKKSFTLGGYKFEIALDKDFLPFIVNKGSVAIDGISLTAANIKGNTFSVYIIPHTLKVTTLGFKGPSSYVNIEVDMLGKYVLSLLKSQQTVIS
ncbi:MAG: riboflavin synthase [Candidatus Omnitrophota bacterium]|nr:riboflavin synthase [Candidatus Omnitrophota bacterium]